MAQSVSTHDDMVANSAMRAPRQLLPAIFSSLSRDSRHWSLSRTLQSDNPMDIKGNLHGTATFTRLQGASTRTDADMLYREEGEMPNTFGMGMPGLRWTKKYVWRLGESGKMSVWFVKVNGGSKIAAVDADGRAALDDDEADYLFHEFDLDVSASSDAQADSHSRPQTNHELADVVLAPLPPPGPAADHTAVLMARGNHLCINDMYRTAYAFRIRPETGDVVSWTSRHVVKGPKKDQDIVNVYQSEG